MISLNENKQQDDQIMELINEIDDDQLKAQSIKIINEKRNSHNELQRAATATATTAMVNNSLLLRFSIYYDQAQQKIYLKIVDAKNLLIKEQDQTYVKIYMINKKKI